MLFTQHTYIYVHIYVHIIPESCCCSSFGTSMISIVAADQGAVIQAARAPLVVKRSEGAKSKTDKKSIQETMLEA